MQGMRIPEKKSKKIRQNRKRTYWLGEKYIGCIQSLALH